MSKTIIALDPGRDKSGLAVLLGKDENIVRLYKGVVPTADVVDAVRQLVQEHKADMLVIGNGTTSKQTQATIRYEMPELLITEVDEYYTTQLARKRYWLENPPQGLRRLLPVTMQVPPVPVDDYVAVILGERYLKQ